MFDPSGESPQRMVQEYVHPDTPSQYINNPSERDQLRVPLQASSEVPQLPRFLHSMEFPQPQYIPFGVIGSDSAHSNAGNGIGVPAAPFHSSMFLPHLYARFRQGPLPNGNPPPPPLSTPPPHPSPSPHGEDSQSEISCQQASNKVSSQYNLDVELHRALAIVAAMFPQLSMGIHSAVLLRVLEDRIHEEFGAGDVVVDSVAVASTLSRFSTSPSLSINCRATLEHLKEAYLDGVEIRNRSKSVLVRMWDGSLKNLSCLGPFPLHSLYSAAAQVAAANLSALLPVPLDLSIPPLQGWIDLNPVSMPLKQAAKAETPVELAGFATSPAARLLASKALTHLDTACKLLGNGADSGLMGISLSSDVDFGVQMIVEGVKGTALAVGPQSLLDALLISGTASSRQSDSAPTPDHGSAPTGAAAESALCFGHLTVEHIDKQQFMQQQPWNDSHFPQAPLHTGDHHQGTRGVPTTSSTHPATSESSQQVWILGGIAAPQLPRTFAAVDTAHLFWSDSDSGVRLEAGERHTITVALCRLDGPGRKSESGILQQALILLMAVPAGIEAFYQLPRIKEAAYVDVYPGSSKSRSCGNGAFPATKNGGGGAGNPPVAVIGSPPFSTQETITLDGSNEQNGPSFRVFACARRVGVALLSANQHAATAQLHADAKPFTPPSLRALFNARPDALHFQLPDEARVTLVAHSDMVVVPAAQKRRMSFALPPEPVVGHPLHPYMQRILRRYTRLLQLEQSSMEEDICRLDQFNCRLTMAFFCHENPRKFTLIHVNPNPDPLHSPKRAKSEKMWRETPSSERSSSSSTDKQHAAAGTGAAPPPEGFYRGPQVDRLFPRPQIPRVKSHVLAMLHVPGLAEGRPALSIGDCVHVRAAKRDREEYVGLVASTQGSTVYLAMPRQFWEDTELKRPLIGCAAAFKKGTVSPQTAMTVQSGWFDGLVHVRFACDHRPIAKMQAALSVAGMMQHTCLVPPIPGDAEASEYAQMRNDGLQPRLAEVEAVAAGFNGVLATGRGRLNKEQRMAVAAVVCGAGRAAPFAIHGPPGTGKTITLVALATHIRAVHPESRLLLCAPQNYSADLICSALAATGVPPSQMFRLNDPRRPPYSMKDDVIPYARVDGGVGMFTVPSAYQLAQYPIVVCTCGAAAHIPPPWSPGSGGGFTHVMIDEGGQALLPETLIPLSMLCPRGDPFEDRGWGAVVCGDPQQLGPIVRSPSAAKSGLASSLLERLIAAHTAAAGELAADGLTPATLMLLENYRSNASLLSLPSKMFYRGELVAAADPISVLPPEWKELYEDEEDADVDVEEDQDGADSLSPTTDVSSLSDGGHASAAAGNGCSPVSLMFYGVRGQQAREGDVASYHNTLEAATVADLVQGLLDSPNAGVSVSDIGVMATYRRQVQSIRILLRQRGLGKVRVGTVDDYQGQEEKVVFISTVLSRPSSLPGGSANAPEALGLWNNPKRFNVAITRAKALLVVVGHPAVLVEDRSWRELVRHCAATGTFRGAGAAALAERTRVAYGHAATSVPLPLSRESDPPVAGLVRHHHDSCEVSSSGEEYQEMALAIDQMAALALLGSGDAALLYPDSLEEMHTAYADEMQWRVML